MTQIIGQRGRRFQAATTSLVAAMTTRPTYTRKLQIDNLMANLNGFGVLPVLDGLYVLAANDAQAASLNWASPSTFPLTLSGSPVLAADRGYTGDAVGASLLTGYNPFTNIANMLQNSMSMFFYSLTAAVSADASIDDMGISNTAINCYTSLGNFGTRGGNSTTDSTVNTKASGAGLFSMRRNNSANYDIDIDGVKLATKTRASSAFSNAAIALLMRTGLPTPTSARQCAIAGFGGYLSQAQILATFSAMRAYLTALGAVS